MMKREGEIAPMVKQDRTERIGAQRESGSE